MKIYNHDATLQGLGSPRRLIEALRRRFAAGCVVPQRHVHHVHPPGETDPKAALTSLLMPAWVPGQSYGVKIVNVAPLNSARGLPGLFASYMLFDATTGQPTALMDGDVITAHRTCAASALAASYVAPSDAEHLLVVGAGRLAALLPRYHGAVRPIRKVSLWARQPAAAQALAARLQSEGIPAEAAPDLAQAASQASIVSCATLAAEPIIRGAWLKPASHLDLIGSFTPSMREADDACFGGGALWWTDTKEALTKSGDLIGPISQGIIRPDDAAGTLADLCRGPCPRPHNGQRTVFKSVGTALEDLATAMLIAGLDEGSADNTL